MPAQIFDYDEARAANVLGVSPRTLRSWRAKGAIAHYVTPGGRIRYQLADLIELQSSMRVPAAKRQTMPPSAA